LRDPRSLHRVAPAAGRGGHPSQCGRLPAAGRRSEHDVWSCGPFDLGSG